MDVLELSLMINHSFSPFLCAANTAMIRLSRASPNARLDEPSELGMISIRTYLVDLFLDHH